MIHESVESVRAFAPATAANLAVGFDLLGLAFPPVGDEVTLTKRKDGKIFIESIESAEPLPKDIHKNTASIALHAACEALQITAGFSLHIKKGIPLCSGMGGSAASAVAALVAFNEFLKSPLSKETLISFARLGEKETSGDAHLDNVVPCLYGGLTLIHTQDPLQVIELPVPSLHCILLHPHLKISTKSAREVLKKEISLKDHVKQSAHLGAFIAALYKKDMALLKSALVDCLIEPQRASLIPGFYEAKQNALEAGALGMSLSGSGPTLFAFALEEKTAEHIATAMKKPFLQNNIACDTWIAPLAHHRAQVIEIIGRK